MARCRICFHKRLRELDGCILAGTTLAAIARRFKVSEDSLSRHKRHMRVAMAKAAAEREPNLSGSSSYGSQLLDQLAAIERDVEIVQREAEDRQDGRLQLLACRQRADLVELKARLQGALEPAGSVVNVTNVNIPESTLVRMAQVYLETHAGVSLEAPMGLPPGVLEGDLSNG